MDHLMTVEGVAVRAGCSSRSVERALRAGTGPEITRIGKLVRFTESAVEDWLTRCRKQAA